MDDELRLTNRPEPPPEPAVILLGIGALFGFLGKAVIILIVLGLFVAAGIFALWISQLIPKVEFANNDWFLFFLFLMVLGQAWDSNTEIKKLRTRLEALNRELDELKRARL